MGADPSMPVPAGASLPLTGMAVVSSPRPGEAIQRFRCGHRGPCGCREKAEATSGEVRLVIKRELVTVLPGTRVHRKRILGLTKTFVMVGAFEGGASSHRTDSMA